LASLAVSAVAAVGAAGSSATAAFGDHAAAVVGHVYVNDNSAGENTIAAFDRHVDGTLSPVAGSPFAAGGSGTGSGIGSQGALQISPDGHYLLAVDAGSNQISVLRIGHQGEISRVDGGLVSSDGAQPVSIAIHGDLVYVANAGNGASNYTGFVLDPDGDGHLRALAHSTFALADGSSPGDVLFNSNGTNLVGTRVGTSLIDSFAVAENGRLVPAKGSPFAAQGPGPFGSEFRPTEHDQLFVSNAHGGEDAATVSAFDVARDGTLTSISGSPFADDQTAACWVEISHDGRYLFTVNTASSSISRYSISPAGSLELLGSTPLTQAKAGAEDARLDPEGESLWVVDSGGRAVSGFSVRRGGLSELASSPTPLPANSAPFGIVVD
jgi:6-phosphogluconolactonase (cycloisomerase 2 family)